MLAFDPFGWFYPPLLVNRLHANPSIHRVHYNRTMFQSFDEKTCGLYCIRFLSSINRCSSPFTTTKNAAKYVPKNAVNAHQ